MLIVDKAEDFVIPFQLKTNEGGLVDITSSTVTCYIKETSTSSVVAIQKVSTDTAQIEKTLAKSGMGIVKILAANTASLTKRNYYYEITDGTNKVTGFIKFKQNTGVNSTAIALHGTTDERTALGLTLTSSDRVWFYDDDDDSPYFWSGTEWT